MQTDTSTKQLEEIALQLRRDTVSMIGIAGSGHPGSSLSVIEILTVLFNRIMRHKPTDPHWPDRDRFVLSKGHAAPALYAVYSQTGYIEKDMLYHLRKLGAPLQGHPDRRKFPIVEASTGSLGQGLSIGIGIAMAAKMDKKDYRTYCLVGDGECNEGQIWEAAMFAAHHKFDNLLAILDYNKFQLDGPVKDVLDMEPMDKKWQSFGWHTIEVDGHQLEEVMSAFEEAKAIKGKPTIIIAHTVKGKGVSFMENNNHFHGVAPTPEELRKALIELKESPDQIEKIFSYIK